LPTNFDSSYCYALGYGAAALLQSGKTGLISSVCANTLFIYLLFIKLNISSRLFLMIDFGLFGNTWAINSIFGFAMIFYQVANLCAPVEEWTVGGTALTSLMDVERRHGMHCDLLELLLCPNTYIFGFYSLRDILSPC